MRDRGLFPAFMISGSMTGFLYAGLRVDAIR